MTRRADLDEAYRHWLREMGKQVSAARARMGWTQARASEHCGLDIKQFQDIEHGRRPVSTRTLFAVAHGLRVQPEDLTRSLHQKSLRGAADDGGVAAQLGTLREQGWRIIELGTWPRPQRAIAIHDLSEAAARQAGAGQPPILAWAQAPIGRRISGPGLFLAYLAEGSAVAAVPAASWCLFRHPVTSPLLGKLVLVRAEAGDGDTDQGYALRRVGAMALTDRGVEVRLDASADGSASRVAVLADEASLPAIGELVQLERI